MVHSQQKRALLYLSPVFDAESSGSNVELFRGVGVLYQHENDLMSEVSLTDLNFSLRENLNAISAETRIGLRYELSGFISPGMTNFYSRVGLAYSALYRRGVSEPKGSSFKTVFNAVDNNLEFVPHIGCELGKGFFVDLCIPFILTSFRYKYQRVHNPAIPIKQQRIGGGEFFFFSRSL